MVTSGRRIRRFFSWTLGIIVGLAVVGVIATALIVRAFIEPDARAFGTVEDEAKHAGLTREDFPAAPEPYFAEMDKGLLLPPEPGENYPPQIIEVAAATGLEPEEVRLAAIRGQNTWTVWTGGNDRFWDFAARTALGSFDLLKTVSSHPSQAYGRYNRWRYLGLVNEPCFIQASGPDPDRYGLWLDQRDPNCPPDPFGGNPEADANYPGVAFGERGKNVGLGSFYGEPTGILGLRLFPNPAFDTAAAKAWDPVRYHEDPSYYYDRKLVRPYRVGMSCAFCHVGPNPTMPPQDPENPIWAELTSNPGAQYFWVDRIFFWNTRPRSSPDEPSLNEGNFLYQLFHTNPPGALDTSLVSTDYMNNPRTMNAVYEVGARLGLAARTGWEQLEGGERDNRQLQDYPQTSALFSLYEPATGRVGSMRVLKDGADSVGALGALNRVYLNIGLFSEEWLLHFRPFLGIQKISPIQIADAQRNSTYWNATEDQTADMAIFFLVTARADRLADAPGGAQHLDALDQAAVERGKVVFAESCAACHSSKQPVPPADYGVDSGICAGGGAGPEYRQCWDRFWAWTQTDEFKQGMVEMVTARDEAGRETFLDGNYLSTERRVPLDLIGTNACSAIATNGLAGDIWDNFTSDTYKSLPPVGEVTVNHPVSGAAMPFQPLGNGRGYLRPAPLVSLWSTAPFMLNNSVGHEERYYRPDYSGAAYNASCPAANPDDPYLPCVENRLVVFEKSIREMLWPETRRTDPLTTSPVPGYMYRTTAPSCLMVPAGYTPDIIRNFSGPLSRIAGWAVALDGSVRIGPFPEGFPVNALVNTKLLPDNDEGGMFAHFRRLITATPTLLRAFSRLGGQCSPEELADLTVIANAEAVVRDTGLIDTLVGLSKCPDYVVNRGHIFGADLSAADKEALISYLKHF